MLQSVDPMIRHQRARGSVSVHFDGDAGQTRLKKLRQAGCLKALLPDTHGNDPCAVLVNTSGGLTGGDELRQEFVLGERASVSCTTQAAERVYRSINGSAIVKTEVTLEDRSAFHWLPQETIIFDEGALNRSLNIDMSSGASCLLLEIFVLGRAAMGETLTSLNISDCWKIRRDGRLVLVEALKLNSVSQMADLATLDSASAFATLAWIAPDAELRLEATRRLIDRHSVRAAASAWNGCLLVRAASNSPKQLRESLTKFLTDFCSASLPKVWHI